MKTKSGQAGFCWGKGKREERGLGMGSGELESFAKDCWDELGNDSSLMVKHVLIISELYVLLSEMSGCVCF